ncbi:MAG: polyprenyl synthetase family protein [Candidatus Omnitrophica bacterium]|nr:polyprenyl synthetase family protein [Candidatus Omnitrophota bacterium]
MNFERQINLDKEIIDKALKKYLEKQRNSSSEVFRAMKYALFPGGKRLRPILSLEASRTCGGNIQNALPAACAIEFIHNFSLIHDDLPSMDNDDFRRGKPTLHRKFGEAIAILAGDALLNLAFIVLSGIKDKDTSARLIEVIPDSIGLNGIIGGQGLDIKYMNTKKTKSLESKINDLKTAIIFSASLTSGAITASASSKKVKRLSSFGRNFGRAFQIYDDIVDKKYKGHFLDDKKIQLKNLIKKAKSSLDIFGKKADNLRYIADGLVLSYKL